MRSTCPALVALTVLLGCSEPEQTPPEQIALPAPVAAPQPPAAPEPPAPPPAPPPPAIAEPVDLLHAVDVTVRVSSAFGDNLQQVGRAFDGDTTSAWNSLSEDLSAPFLEVRLPADADVTSIALTSGFTHQRPNRDLFHGNFRVRRVRVTREGVEVGRFPLDIEQQSLQTLNVTGAGGTWRVELIELEPGNQPTWREACVSELRVMGRAPSMSAGAHTPVSAVVSPDERARIQLEITNAVAGVTPTEDEAEDEALEDEGEDEALEDEALEDEALEDEADEDEGLDEGEDDEGSEQETALASDPAAAAILAQREGLHLTELTIGPEVVERQVVGARTRFSRATDERVNCLLRIENPDRMPTTVTMQWVKVDDDRVLSERPMNIPAQPRYVTWGYAGTRARNGRYRCVIRDEEGTVLGSAAYELAD